MIPTGHDSALRIRIGRPATKERRRRAERWDLLLLVLGRRHGCTRGRLSAQPSDTTGYDNTLGELEGASACRNMQTKPKSTRLHRAVGTKNQQQMCLAKPIFLSYTARVHNNVSIVLVEPQGPRNIGAVARAMQNFGFLDLRVVKGVPFHGNDALEMACNAKDILRSGRTFQSLRDALKDCIYSVAFTRRAGQFRAPVKPYAEELPNLAEKAKAGRICLVFGRETDGLTNPEVQECDAAVVFQTAQIHASLNLSQAVCVALYEMNRAIDNMAPPPAKKATDKSEGHLVTKEELEPLFPWIERIMTTIGYDEGGKDGLRERNMKKIRSVFSRAGLSEFELNMSFAVCHKLEKLFLNKK